MRCKTACINKIQAFSGFVCDNLLFCFCCYVLSATTSGKENGDIIKIIFAIGGAVYYWANRVKKAFEKEVKQGVINSFLSFFGDFRWSMDEHLEREGNGSFGLTGSITTITVMITSKALMMV